jgi:REP element-mobilizing transposase RayT
MPNHIHGIVHIGTAPSRVANISLTDLVQTFKSLTTVEYARGVRENRYPTYDRVLWQRSFYDRILRDRRSLEAARQYIESNPARWIEKREALS